ncbi:uncharacterized protein LOC113237370 [Hyposmocoma kahamanoa]|uniref:uncharacterized protein LOC113229443 n=1 Tax=Hyposmocoma kahamanoa TaxID=1477025 RepID=UPI000E6D888E|nr:uncharacterized protein LOC113229443 [Hyposmocoma kahamanoa]XP_026329583.1 uncharacterized protein LOC113237370 [Hyposmocoma kahamanoa]
MGDLNTCLLKDNVRSARLNCLVNSVNFVLLPLTATHHSPNCQPSLLDVQIVSKPNSVLLHGQTTAPFSYHDLIYLSYRVRTPKPKTKVRLQRNFRAICVDRLRDDFSRIDWSSLFEACTVNEKIKIFNYLLLTLYNTHAPLRPVRVKHLPAPWLTPTIKKCMQRRDKAKSILKRYPSDDNLLAYKRLRNLCNRLCRDAKRRYIHSSIEGLSTGQTWKFLRSLGVGKDCDSTVNIPDLNLLNKHFTNPPLVVASSVKVATLASLGTITNPTSQGLAHPLSTL